MTSTVLDDWSSRHTGNGRIIRKMMRTLSLYETGDSNGAVSLLDLKNGKFTPAMSKKGINDYAYYVCRGGWPVAIGKNRDITTFGLLFESLVVHDLRVYADTIGARVYKYRDSKRREADAVIQFNDGSWALIEVKLGGEDDIRTASENLIKIADDIDWDKTGKPAFLMVVTKNKVAYRMDNGVYVVLLCCLKN